jgi:hypothetical protein
LLKRANYLIENALHRPAPANAIEACRAFNAKLVIAKLDRLRRDAHFLLGLEKAGIEFVAVDMPHANRLTVGIMALVTEQERTATGVLYLHRSSSPGFLPCVVGGGRHGEHFAAAYALGVSI